MSTPNPSLIEAALNNKAVTQVVGMRLKNHCVAWDKGTRAIYLGRLRGNASKIASASARVSLASALYPR